MRNLIYKTMMFIMQVLISVMLFLLCNHFNVFDVIKDSDVIICIKRFFLNDYIISILSGIISVTILYFFQMYYCKYKIKKDFRCNEALEDLSSIFTDLDFLLDKAEDISNNYKPEYSNTDGFIEYFKMYDEHRLKFSMNGYIVNEKINVLVDSIQSTLLLNLNFKLLGILNNIKNRKPNIVSGSKDVEDTYLKYSETKEENDLISCGREIRDYLIDLKFMKRYFFELFIYLNYDNTKTVIFNELLKQYIPNIEDYVELTEYEQNKLLYEISKESKRQYTLYKFKTFLSKEK